MDVDKVQESNPFDNVATRGQPAARSPISHVLSVMSTAERSCFINESQDESQHTEVFSVPLALFRNDDLPALEQGRTTGERVRLAAVRESPAPLLPEDAEPTVAAAQPRVEPTHFPTPSPVVRALPSPLTSALEHKLKRLKSAERVQDVELARVREALNVMASDVCRDIERLEAAERRLQQKQKQLDELLKEVQALEENREASQSARKALEALRSYYQSQDERHLVRKA